MRAVVWHGSHGAIMRAVVRHGSHSMAVSVVGPGSHSVVWVMGHGAMGVVMGAAHWGSSMICK